MGETWRGRVVERYAQTVCRGIESSPLSEVSLMGEKAQAQHRCIGARAMLVAVTND